MERLKTRGFHDMTVDFTPKPTFPMSKEEKEKDKKRKQTNRDSAQRCRQKQKQEDEINRNILKRLKVENEKLLNKVNQSEEEKNKLLFELRRMVPEHYIHQALRKIEHVTSEKEHAHSPTESRTASEQDVELNVNKSTLIPSDFIFPDNCIFQENCPESEIFFQSFHFVFENERLVHENVDYLCVGNEETVQFLDDSMTHVGSY